MAESETPVMESSPDSAPPLRSIHIDTFAQILDRRGSSIAVTTYRAGKLVLLRAKQGSGEAMVNTHFCGYHKPMGFAAPNGKKERLETHPGQRHCSA
jgi:hypothetical protein